MEKNKDRLAKYRFSDQKDQDEFFSWFSQNCVKATSDEEVRKILRPIKKPLLKAINE